MMILHVFGKQFNTVTTLSRLYMGTVLRPTEPRSRQFFPYTILYV